MKTFYRPPMPGLAAMATLLLAMPFLGAPAAAASATSRAEAAYRQERADCLAGRSSQDRATCLKEAGAALAEARRPGSKAADDAGSLMFNAQRRCQVFAPADREQCMRMARGEGHVSGSVSGGGQFKELTTVIPAPPVEVRR